ncbi:LAFA_0B07998g1_1 [Lachancea sp. 'fantastica']|nr:LAFA_0B07998g1_1 [Lachancea sp. 'fantastica']
MSRKSYESSAHVVSMELNVSLETQSGVFTEILEALSSISSRLKNDAHHRDLLVADLNELSRQWQHLQVILESGFDLQCSYGEVLEKFADMARVKNDFYMVFQTIAVIESRLVELLDDVESSITEEANSEDLNTLIDSFEDCWMKLDRLKILLRSSRYTLESGLEFNAILNDNILALDALIDGNAEKCFEIKEGLKSSEISRTSFGSEKRVSSVLSECAETGFARVPTLLEESDLFEKFVTIRDTMEPLEENLRHTLHHRIEQFGSRKINYAESLVNILRAKYNEVCQKHESLLIVFHLLQEELVNSRWKELFKSLNKIIEQDISAASAMVTELVTLSKIGTLERAKLLSLQREIENNFNIVYQALHSSVLSVDVADQSNELANRWLDVGTQIEELCSQANAEEDLASGIQKLSLRQEESTEKRPTQARSSSVGALLFKRMNIKPVMVDTTPKSAVKTKPLYQPSLKSQPARLNFESIPNLSQPNASNLKKGSSILSPIKSAESDPMDEVSTTELLQQKIVHFSSLKSRIPVYRCHQSNIANSITVHLSDPMKVVLKSSNLFSLESEVFRKCQLSSSCLPKLQLS